MKEMNKHIKKFFCLLLLPALLATTPVYANIMDSCTAMFAANQETFLKPLTKDIFKDAAKLEEQNVKKNRAKILTLLAGNIFTHCNADLAEIAETPRGRVDFVYKDQKYAFAFNTTDVFEYLDMRTGIMVYNKRDNTAGDVIKVGDIKKLYWSKDCSDHVIWDNLDDDAAVNVAGQKTFSSYGGSKHEFFLDFEEGNNRRVFPGLVLMDETWSTQEKLVTFTNLPTAIEAAKKFQTNLKNSSCSNQGLAVYVVALDVRKTDTKTNKTGWAIAASVGGGTLAYIGLSAALATTSAVAATGSMALVNATLAGASVASSVPVYGWVVAGVLVAAAGVISLIPGEIENIQQVMVISGPYNI